MAVRVVMIIGSGETDRVMTTTHQRLVARLDPPVDARMLDTPYGFQENADRITERLHTWFAHHVGLDVQPVRLPRADTADPLLEHDLQAALDPARWVFAGPGSPSYALAQWRRTPVPDLLRGKLRTGGALVFASAAACTLGRLAIPVYEIYKAGHDPVWLDGLDLLSEAGLDVAVVPHFDNRSGREHDTRFCYMGERRMRVLEQQLPPGTAILGVDELTAGTIDLDADTLSVTGKGAVTVRGPGGTHLVPSGRTVALERLRTLAAGTVGARSADTGTDGGARRPPAAATVPGARGAAAAPGSPGRVAAVGEADEVRRWRDTFEGALEAGDLREACRAALRLEDVSAGPAGSARTAAARAALREVIYVLGDLAARDGDDDQVADLVEILLDVRDAARERGDWEVADRIRAGLTSSGLEIRDTRQGTRWLASGG